MASGTGLLTAVFGRLSISISTTATAAAAAAARAPPRAPSPWAIPSRGGASRFQMSCGALRPVSTTARLSQKDQGKGAKGKQAGGKQAGAKRKGKKGRRAPGPNDARLAVLSMGLGAHKRSPPPLRMTRMRYLRHWTIHRAWLLFRRKQREIRERTLMQQFQSMHNACEELRNTGGPGLRDTGYLYRVAMEKKGVYRHHGIPIEYARAQTETPAKEPWNHEWKR